MCAFDMRTNAQTHVDTDLLGLLGTLWSKLVINNDSTKLTGLDKTLQDGDKRHAINTARDGQGKLALTISGDCSSCNLVRPTARLPSNHHP